MRIKSLSHIPWAIAAVLVIGASALIYFRHATGVHHGPSGSSFWGLTFGILAALCMFITAALGFRRWFRSARLGSARLWLMMHLYLGFLTLPLVLFHAGFRWGEPLTWWIMLLLWLVWLSGIYGILLQQFLPGYLKIRVPNERLHLQIKPAMKELREQAEKLAQSAKAVADLYSARVQPFLLLSSPSESSYHAVASACQEVRARLGPAAAPVDELEKICGDYRNLRMEKRLLFLMHSWLLVHVPLSMALLALTALHIVMAWRLAF